MQKLFFVSIILFFKAFSYAQTTVYFFEYRLSNGSVYSFDEGGRFYHTALKVDDKVLEAHPFYGARLASDLSSVGHLAAILYSPDPIENLNAKVQALLGRKFDLYSPWDNPQTTQCSKLVGQIIGVSPVVVQGGNLSLSPDLLYAELIKRGFTDIPISLASEIK